mmetsp:Transcript_368/g.570  ORF Transcript_368/g.570 Transcript_368/m.570 type:complete len:218 (-) Transcript_368:2902-3555(-)
MGNATSDLGSSSQSGCSYDLKNHHAMHTPLLTDKAREVLFSSMDDPVTMNPEDCHKFIYHALEQVDVALSDLDFPYNSSILNVNIEVCRYIVLLKKGKGLIRYHWFLHVQVGKRGKITYDVCGFSKIRRGCDICSLACISGRSADVEFDAVKKGVHEGFSNCFEDIQMKQSHVVDLSPGDIKDLYRKDNEVGIVHDELFLNSGFNCRERSRRDLNVS